MGDRQGFARWVRRFRGHGSGSVAIEFAILAPVLLLLVLGTLRIGHMIGVQHALSQLAASAARQALPASGAERRERAAREYVLEQAQSFALLDASRIELRISESPVAIRVLVSMDVSHIPDIPIVSAAFRFPTLQTANAVIAVQN